MGLLGAFRDELPISVNPSPQWKIVAQTMATGFAVCCGFALLPLYGFRTIDEVKREHNFIGFTGGGTAVLAGFPMWAVLHAGGIGAAPHPFGVWLLGFAGMIIAYLYAKWRV